MQASFHLEARRRVRLAVAQDEACRPVLVEPHGPMAPAVAAGG